MKLDLKYMWNNVQTGVIVLYLTGLFHHCSTLTTHVDMFDHLMCSLIAQQSGYVASWLRSDLFVLCTTPLFVFFLQGHILGSLFPVPIPMHGKKSYFGSLSWWCGAEDVGVAAPPVFRFIAIVWRTELSRLIRLEPLIEFIELYFPCLSLCSFVPFMEISLNPPTTNVTRGALSHAWRHKHIHTHTHTYMGTFHFVLIVFHQRSLLLI